MHLGTLCQGWYRLGVLTMLENLIIFLTPWWTSTTWCSSPRPALAGWAKLIGLGMAAAGDSIQLAICF